MICSGQQAPSTSYQEKTDGKAHSAKEASLASGSNTDKRITPSSGLGVSTTGVLKKNPSIVNIKQEKAAPSSAAQSSNTISPASNTPAVYQSGPTENDFTDGASAKKRSRSKSTAAQFLKASLGINKKVITTASCDPVLVDSEASAPEATVALPSDSRKRPSPQRATEEGKEGLLDLEIKEQTLDVATEHEDQHDDNRSKKPRFGHSESDLEQALSKATAMKLNIDQTIKCFLDKVGNDFTNLPRHCEPEKTDKYEERKGILVPQSTDCDLGDMASYLRSDLTRIQKLIAAPVLDKAVLSSRIEKCLKCWSAMLQGKIPKELKELMDELEYLKNSLSDKAAHAIPCSVYNLRAYEEHVKERMDIGQKSHQSVMIGYNSLTDYSTVWGDLQDEVKKRKAKYLAEIKELENALRLVRSKLRSEQEYEAELKKLSDQYDEIVSETSTAISVFEETLTHGESCLEKINQTIGEVESQGGSELPVNLRNQLKFIESCMIEGDENDEE